MHTHALSACNSFTHNSQTQTMHAPGLSLSTSHSHTHSHTRTHSKQRPHIIYLPLTDMQPHPFSASLYLTHTHAHTRTHTHSLPDVARGLQPWPDSRQWKRSVLYTLYGFPWFGKAAEHRDQLKVQRHESTANSFHRTHTDMLTKENLYNFQTTLYMFLPVQSMVEG